MLNVDITAVTAIYLYIREYFNLYASRRTIERVEKLARWIYRITASMYSNWCVMCSATCSNKKCWKAIFGTDNVVDSVGWFGAIICGIRVARQLPRAHTSHWIWCAISLLLNFVDIERTNMGLKCLWVEKWFNSFIFNATIKVPLALAVHMRFDLGAHIYKQLLETDIYDFIFQFNTSPVPSKWTKRKNVFCRGNEFYSECFFFCLPSCNLLQRVYQSDHLYSLQYESKRCFFYIKI